MSNHLINVNNVPTPHSKWIYTAELAKHHSEVEPITVLGIWIEADGVRIKTDKHGIHLLKTFLETYVPYLESPIKVGDEWTWSADENDIYPEDKDLPRNIHITKLCGKDTVFFCPKEQIRSISLLGLTKFYKKK
jgi:hypothetical protein